MGGSWCSGWGADHVLRAETTVRRALDLGINWIDTAPLYGLGSGEELIARSLLGVPRERVFLATKCGRVWDAQRRVHFDLRPASIRAECEASLRRLRTDCVDLLQIHWPDRETGTPLEESWGELARLKAEGKARWIGVSNFSVPEIETCLQVAPVDSLQPPYSLLERAAESALLPFCLAHGIAVLAYSPLASGLLSGHLRPASLAPDDMRRRNAHYKGPRLAAALEAVDSLRRIADERCATPAQLALAWVASHPAVTAAIAGAKRPEQIEEAAGAMTIRLSAGDRAAIAELFSAVAVVGTPA